MRPLPLSRTCRPTASNFSQDRKTFYACECVRACSREITGRRGFDLLFEFRIEDAEEKDGNRQDSLDRGMESFFRIRRNLIFFFYRVFIVR